MILLKPRNHALIDPKRPLAINWAHPAAGRIVAAIANYGRGWLDLIGGNVSAVDPAYGYIPALTNFGTLFTRSGSISENPAQKWRRSTTTTSDMSLMALFRVEGASPGATYRGILRAGGGGGFIGLGVYENVPGSTLHGTVRRSGAYTNFGGSFAATVGKAYACVVTHKYGARQRLYVEGKLDPAEGAETAASDYPFNLLEPPINNTNFGGPHIAWDCELPQELAEELSAEPLALFRPVPPPRVYSLPAAGAGAALAAEGAGQGAVAAQLATSIPVAAAVLGVGAAAGGLATAVPLTGLTAGVGLAAGELVAEIRLEAAVLEVALAQAELATGIPLAAQVQGLGAVAAQLNLSLGLSASALGRALINAELTGAIRLAAGVGGQGAVTAQLAAGPSFAAQVLGQGGAAGALTTSLPLSAAVLGQALAAGGLTVQILLAALVAGQANTAAALSAQIRFGAEAAGQGEVVAVAAVGEFLAASPGYTLAALARSRTVQAGPRRRRVDGRARRVEVAA